VDLGFGLIIADPAADTRFHRSAEPALYGVH
jgi:hypothetical protein